MIKKYILFLVLIIVSISFLKYNKNDECQKMNTKADSMINHKTNKTLFGFPIDSFIIHTNVIKKNEFLANILSKYNVPYSKIEKLENKSKKIFDIRKIKAGHKYYIFCNKDSANSVKCFIYEPNPLEYVVFQLCDSIFTYKEKRKIKIDTAYASGIIFSSLYQTLEENNISPVLAVKMSEIFAWSIDFYRIQKGDKFKIIYERKYADDKLVGTGKILAAYFEHYSKPFYAFYFKYDNKYDYFDEKGNSLRKAFLKAPLKFSRISSAYSLRRFHPILKKFKLHLGTDYAAPEATPIYAVGDGVVIEAQYKKNNGNYVKIKHNSVYTTQYLHMKKFAKGIKKGVFVKQGEIIGYVGHTGLATGPHVCFRFWKNGKQIDHRKEHFPSANPVPVNYKNNYFDYIKVLKAKLDSITISDKKPFVN